MARKKSLSFTINWVKFTIYSLLLVPCAALAAEYSSDNITIWDGGTIMNGEWVWKNDGNKIFTIKNGKASWDKKDKRIICGRKADTIQVKRPIKEYGILTEEEFLLRKRYYQEWNRVNWANINFLLVMNMVGCSDSDLKRFNEEAVIFF